MAWFTENLRNCQAWKEAELEISTPSDEAAKYYDLALRQLASWTQDEQSGGFPGTFQKMLEADPNFIMGKVFILGLDVTGTGRSARKDFEFAYNLHQLETNAAKETVLPREKLHVKAVKLFADGFTTEALEVWENILTMWPTDLLAVKQAYLSNIYLGNSPELRDSIKRVLPSWKPQMQFYSFLKGMYAFGLEENGQLVEAEKEAKEALEINKRDAWAVHSMAHIFETGENDRKGLKFMEATENNWSSCGLLAGHNYWHWGLFHVLGGEHQEALSLFDSCLNTRINSDIVFNLIDATSFLYRLGLQGVDVGNRWEAVSEVCLKHLDDHILSFNDAHFLMAFLNDSQLSQHHIHSMEIFIKEGVGTNQNVCLKVGLPLCEAIRAYHEEDFPQAVAKLYPIRNEIFKIGGSRAQRDVFTQLLLRAVVNSPNEEHKKLASEILLERQRNMSSSRLAQKIVGVTI